MREIKFRFWDEAEKEFHEGDWALKDLIVLGSQELYETELKGFIPMQFTGLKDKTGKEIYEGDIIEFDGQPSYGVIEWDGLNCAFRIVISECVSSALTWELLPLIKIEGNLHENPELLKDK